MHALQKRGEDEQPKGKNVAEGLDEFGEVESLERSGPFTDSATS